MLRLCMSHVHRMWSLAVALRKPHSWPRALLSFNGMKLNAAQWQQHTLRVCMPLMHCRCLSLAALRRSPGIGYAPFCSVSTVNRLGRLTSSSTRCLHATHASQMLACGGLAQVADQWPHASLSVFVACRFKWLNGISTHYTGIFNGMSLRLPQWQQHSPCGVRAAYALHVLVIGGLAQITEHWLRAFVAQSQLQAASGGSMAAARATLLAGCACIAGACLWRPCAGRRSLATRLLGRLCGVPLEVAQWHQYALQAFSTASRLGPLNGSSARHGACLPLTHCMCLLMAVLHRGR